MGSRFEERIDFRNKMSFPLGKREEKDEGVEQGSG